MVTRARLLVLALRKLLATSAAARRRWAIETFVASVVLAVAFPSVALAAPTITAVTFGGDAANPQITIAGQGFGAEPAATNPGYQGYTGFDYGNELYLCDTSPDPNAFCGGQGPGDTIGLVVTTYTDSQITYSIGSDYAQYYYPSGIFRLQQGDMFTLGVKGATCSGVLNYNAVPISCGSKPRPHKRRHPKRHRVHYRVFSRGHDQIAIPPGKGLAAAYYHLVITASQPFPHRARQIRLDPIVVDSRSGHVLLHFTSAGAPDVVLTGVVHPTPIAVSRHGTFRLHLSVPLTNLTTGAPAGVFTYRVKGRASGHRHRAASASAAGGGGGSGDLSFSLSAALDVYAHVIDAAGDSGTIAETTATLPAVEKGSGDSPSRGRQLPVGSTYKGPTTYNLPITVELTDDKAGLKHLDWSNPSPIPCSVPGTYRTGGENSMDISGPIAANGMFTAYGVISLYGVATSGPPVPIVDGYEAVSVAGRFTRAVTRSGVTVQEVQASYTDTAYVIDEFGAADVCATGGGFTANVVRTSG